uniref:tetratricopeptide repeat protein n=1 Tax=Streptomyces triticisoli TaxID=2182797 RepID=UPI0013005759
LAVSYTDAGRTQEALELDERVLADYERLLGLDHPDTLTARSNLAVSYRDAGRIREALDLCERVLVDRERLFGLDHPDTLTARNNVTHARSAVEAVQQSSAATTTAVSDTGRLPEDDEKP